MARRKPEQIKRLRIEGRFATKGQLSKIIESEFQRDDASQLYDNDTVRDDLSALQSDVDGPPDVCQTLMHKSKRDTIGSSFYESNERKGLSLRDSSPDKELETN